MAGVPTIFSGLGTDYSPFPANVQWSQCPCRRQLHDLGWRFLRHAREPEPDSSLGADGLEKAGGIFPFEFGNALCDVGVDPDGDISFTDGDTDKVREIDRTTSTLTGAGFGGGDSALGSTCIFSIDSAGNFYVSERSGTFGEVPVRKFDPEGNVLYDLDVPGSGFGGIGDIAVDLSNDRVFVSNTTSDTVFVFESNSAVPMFEIESEGEPQGVAVDSVTHDAYIVGTGGVQIWIRGRRPSSRM